MTTPSGESRDFSYATYRDVQEGTTDIFASTWRPASARFRRAGRRRRRARPALASAS